MLLHRALSERKDLSRVIRLITGLVPGSRDLPRDPKFLFMLYFARMKSACRVRRITNSNNSNSIEKEKRAVTTEKRAIENENRLLRQLLQANNIPFVGSAPMNFGQTLPNGNLLSGSNYPDGSSATYNSYVDPNDSFNNLSPGSQAVTVGPSPTVTDATMGLTPPIQGALSSVPTSTYSPVDTPALNFNSHPTVNGGLSMPPVTNPLVQTQKSNQNHTTNRYGDGRGKMIIRPEQLVPQPFFDDPDDPMFIEFVVE